jgi:hypothetical protein
VIGSGAGINLFREFGPGFRQMIKGHAPKLESRVEERITNDQIPKEVVSTPARIMSRRAAHFTTDRR